VSVRYCRRLGAVAASGALVALLAGCTLPDVSLSPGFSQAAAQTSAPATTAAVPSPAAAARTTAPAPSSAAPTPTRPSGDLDTGSLTHSLPAGARTVVVDYWTTQNAKEWRAHGTKTIQVAAHVEGGGTASTVEVTRFSATADDGTSRTTAAQDDGQFVITPPYSYSSVITLLPSSPRASAVTLYVQFDLLVETYTGSGQFYRQTVLDTLKLPLLQEASQ
jgi:hypothetical protein